jgi:hypothetical protein
MEIVEKQRDIVLSFGRIKIEKHPNAKGRLFEFIPKTGEDDCQEALIEKMGRASNYLRAEFNFEKEDTLKMTVRPEEEI